MYLQIILNFFIGLLVGWILEFCYRSFNAERVVMPLYINCQIYGLSGAFLALLYFFNISIYFKLILMYIIPLLIEFLTGYLYLKLKGIYLWDYSDEFCNFKGIICLRFSLYWFFISLTYYFIFFPFVLNLF